jgi:DNA-binding CsgD family transcriptional regulator
MAFGALAAVESDDVIEAERLLARAQAVYAGQDWSFFLRATHWAEAVLAWRAGRPTGCVEMLGPAAARLVGMQARTFAAFALLDLAEAAADAGDADAATAAAEDLRGVAEVVAIPLYRGYAAAGWAWARLAAGDAGQAAESAQQAIDWLSATDCAAHLGRAYHVLGLSLRAEERHGAVAALERASAIFEQCGCHWRRQRSLEAMRRLGSAGRRAVAAALGPDALTRREREVARLAATGMTAKQIAGSLFVGERTVESHLASVYAKLGVDSKLQLVRRATELGLS